MPPMSFARQARSQIAAPSGASYWLGGTRPVRRRDWTSAALSRSPIVESSLLVGASGRRWGAAHSADPFLSGGGGSGAPRTGCTNEDHHGCLQWASTASNRREGCRRCAADLPERRSAGQRRVRTGLTRRLSLNGVQQRSTAPNRRSTASWRVTTFPARRGERFSVTEVRPARRGRVR
jgi:hypothetical protein